MWLFPGMESKLAVGRLMAAVLAFIFALALLVLERPLDSRR
jgi:hypothetical protein